MRCLGRAGRKNNECKYQASRSAKTDEGAYKIHSELHISIQPISIGMGPL